MDLLKFSQSFLEAVPTAELEPITETYVQSDEVSFDPYINKTPPQFSLG